MKKLSIIYSESSTYIIINLHQFTLQSYYLKIITLKNKSFIRDVSLNHTN